MIFLLVGGEHKLMRLQSLWQWPKPAPQQQAMAYSLIMPDLGLFCTLD